MIPQANIFSPSKVEGHPRRIEAYWNGDSIYPVTVELDLTQRCTRSCPSCPYSAARRPGHALSLAFLDRLFSILGPHTPGLILSGGEATSVAHYSQTLALARDKGFTEISTITNGTCLHLAKVQDALLTYGTAVRVSLYDWQEGDSPSFRDTLRRIETLRRRADSEGSALQIGTSILTRKEWISRYAPVALAALDAGAHWVYFHPFCADWESKRPRITDQTGVLEFIKTLHRIAPADANIQVPTARYLDYPLFFSELHAAHFLLEVGADGINYAGPECKYEMDLALLDLNECLNDNFLWHPRRLAVIKAINSSNYRYIGTRHRPPMFSDYLERTRPGKAKEDRSGESMVFIHPSIL